MHMQVVNMPCYRQYDVRVNVSIAQHYHRYTQPAEQHLSQSKSLTTKYVGAIVSEMAEPLVATQSGVYTYRVCE
jgi:fructose-1,6-bisphosphatase